MQSEKKFVIDGVKQGLRSDGRACLQSRVLECADNTELLAAGSSQIGISLYASHIICGVKAEIANEPGTFLSIEVAGRSSTGFRDRLKEITIVLNQLVLKYIEKDQLVIIKDKKSWKLFIDVLILQENSSNLLEHISFAIWRALKNTQIIGVTGFINKNTDEEFLQVNDIPRKLNIDNVPVLISVAFIDECLILDLTELEELCIDVVLHISIDYCGNIKGITKEGTGSLTYFQTCRALTTCKLAAKQFFEHCLNSNFQYKA
jgi:exosome complex RNA-binding protein Rrp42 (RNase PH superfamily)